MARTYIIVFAQIYDDFRVPELDALDTLFGLGLEYDRPCDVSRPYMLARMPSDREARLLGSRAILIRHVLEWWADGPSYEALHALNKQHSALWTPYIPNTSFKVSVSAYDATLAQARKTQLVEDLSYMGFEGPIVMKDPELEVCLHEEHVAEHRKHEGEEAAEGGPHSRLRRIWLGRKICDGQRSLIDLFDLKKRKYIGNTSMEAGLSLLMANQALVSKGTVVVDPFCGTGSMLYPAAHFGALVVGSDIDGRQMRGKGTSNGIHTAAAQYGVEANLLDFCTYDLTQNPWRTGGIFDAIICDPPYGVRAGAKRLGRKDPSKLRDEPYKLPATGEWSHERSDYIPPSKPWEMSEVLEGVLGFAARMLKPGGRLVYWLPTATENYKDADVPARDGLRLISNSCQDFGKWQRRLITMEKRPSPGATHVSADAPSLADALRALPDGVRAGSEAAAAALGHAKFREQYYAGFR